MQEVAPTPALQRGRGEAARGEAGAPRICTRRPRVESVQAAASHGRALRQGRVLRQRHVSRHVGRKEGWNSPVRLRCRLAPRLCLRLRLRLPGAHAIIGRLVCWQRQQLLLLLLFGGGSSCVHRGVVHC